MSSGDRKILFSNEHFEIIEITWTKDQTSAFHGHGWSQCQVLVQEGLFENTHLLGFKIEKQILEQGQVLSNPIGSQHQIMCLSPFGKTLHVYMPRINLSTVEEKFSSDVHPDLRVEMKLADPVPMSQLTNILSQLQKESVSTFSPFFMNQLFSGVMPQTLLAEDFIAKTRTTLATHEASPVLSQMETEVIRALNEIIGWRTGSGICVPGGSSANFMALHCARYRAFPAMREKGNGNQVMKVFVSQEAHYSFRKACLALGFGTDHLVTIEADSQGRMVISDLEKQIQQTLEKGQCPLLVAATAGTTVLGSFDPIRDLANICQKNQIWLHVDGAWGGPALFSKRLNHLMNGLEMADSMTFDGHKLLGASLTSSYFLTCDESILFKANDVNGADYLFHQNSEGIDRGQLSWQCGRRGDAASFWTIWKSLGTQGLGQAVDQLLEVRDQIIPWIKDQPRLQLVAEPAYLNICVKVLAPEGMNDENWSQHVREVLKKKNQAFVNYSGNSEGLFLRLILANPFITKDHVQQILEWALKVQITD